MEPSINALVGKELWIGIFEDGEIKKGQRIAGGSDESVLQPEWSPASDLFYLERPIWMVKLIDFQQMKMN